MTGIVRIHEKVVARRTVAVTAPRVPRDPDVVTSAPLLTLLREDLRRHAGSWVHPGFHALVVYRIGHWASSRTSPAAAVVGLLAKFVNRLIIRNVYGMEIAHDAVIGRRVAIAHHQGVIINGHAVVGDGTVLRHNVTLGFLRNDAAKQDVPHLGRDVQVSPGAQILGPITVGDGARIGPNTVVTVDVPAGATVFPDPVRIEDVRSPTSPS
jgi:serine O-acetyltransferase